MYYLLTWVFPAHEPKMYLIRDHTETDEQLHKAINFCSMEFVKFYDDKDVMEFVLQRFPMTDFKTLLKEAIKIN